MSGSDSSAPAAHAAPSDQAALLNLSVHSLPAPGLAADAMRRRTRRGRLLMLVVLLVCAAPVVASYFAYFVARPQSRTNYSDLIDPPRPIPSSLALADLQGSVVAPASLKGQWLLVVVSGGACDAGCERRLLLQRQLFETLGREKDRVDKLWIIDDATPPRAATLNAVGGVPAKRAGTVLTPTTVLRVDRSALAGWLAPASGQALEDHLYLVDPMGQWMLRAPAEPEPAKLKSDLEKLLRASASWDQPGR